MSYNFTTQQLGDDIGFSLRPPKTLRKIGKFVKKNVTLKRALLVGAGVVAAPYLSPFVVGGAKAAARIASGGLRFAGKVTTMPVTSGIRAVREGDLQQNVPMVVNTSNQGPVPAPMIEQVDPHPVPFSATVVQGGPPDAEATTASPEAGTMAANIFGNPLVWIVGGAIVLAMAGTGKRGR